MMGEIEKLESQNITLQRRLDEAEAAVKRLTAERDKAIAGQHLAAEAAAAGARPSAIPDVVDRALRSGPWKLNSKGKPVRHAADGFPELDGKADPITPRSVVESFRSEVPDYFTNGEQTSAETPARSAPASKASADLNGMENPWKNFNLTKQAEIFVRDPSLAQRLADAAGVPLIGGTRPGSR
jgi:hypothetical protein